jgi:hypothetical protein
MNNHIQPICKCEHGETVHNLIPKIDSNVTKASCVVSDCLCEGFQFDKNMCLFCLEEAQPTQYARALNPDNTAKKFGEVLVCRNFPHCEKAEVEPKTLGTCGCDNAQCAKCLLTNCSDDKCTRHPLSVKEDFRKKYKNR